MTTTTNLNLTTETEDREEDKDEALETLGFVYTVCGTLTPAPIGD